MQKKLLLFFVFVWGVVSIFAQTTGGWTGSGEAVEPTLPTLFGVEGPIIPEEYTLMPGDRILVTVGGKVSYSYQSLVTYEGKITINMPLTPATPSYSSETERSAMLFDIVDAVSVAGLSLAAAQDTLTKAFRRYFKDATVKLTLIGLHRAIVFVAGAVLKPGAYNASPVERVSQAIARAGGISSLGSKSKISLIRGGVPYAIVDIGRFERDGDLQANPFVKTGDVIYVPPAEGFVTVKGAIYPRRENPQPTSDLRPEKEGLKGEIYELKPGERVLDIIQKTAGLTSWADLHNCYVERLVVGSSAQRKRIPVDLHRVLSARDSSQNIELVNGDILVVPPTNSLVYVEGEVEKPGPYSYLPNMRVGDYIGQAGGPTQNGNVRGAVVIRKGKRISGKNNPTVEPGDIVRVPRYGLKWWQDYVDILSAVGIPTVTMVISIIALQR